jgi:hypothetical protein
MPSLPRESFAVFAASLTVLLPRGMVEMRCNAVIAGDLMSACAIGPLKTRPAKESCAQPHNPSPSCAVTQHHQARGSATGCGPVLYISAGTSTVLCLKPSRFISDNFAKYSTDRSWSTVYGLSYLDAIERWIDLAGHI